ncbi:hypothetical protein V2J09_008442 [Rumex salicifolius]
MHHRGKLDVLLVSAKSLEASDYFSKNDPYAVLTCRTQEFKSSVASAGNGTNPQWNENFVFSISGDVSYLSVKLYDKDTFTADDYLGQAEIPLEAVFDVGNFPVSAYNIVKDEKYCGQVKLSLTFRPEPERSHARGLSNEELGGWKCSSFD